MSNLHQKVQIAESHNVFKTWMYMLLFALILGLIGFILASVFNNPIFLYTGFAMALGTNIFSYWFSDSMVLKMAGASPINENEYRALVSTVEELARKMEIPKPKIYIVNDASPNAFATGRNPKNAAIAFTTGILALLNEEELNGVIAHELSHVKNRDTLIMTIVAVMASVISFIANFAYSLGNRDDGEGSNPIMAIIGGLIIAILAPLAATIIQMAISRKREFLADISGSSYTEKPMDLASALSKISNFPLPLRHQNPTIAHMYISDPTKSEGYDDEEQHHVEKKVPWFQKLFMTHPPVGERIEVLQNLKS